jgi:hypothetical protein
VELVVPLTVIDTCKRARGTNSLVVAAALARLDELSLELDGLCRRLSGWAPGQASKVSGARNHLALGEDQTPVCSALPLVESAC